MNRTINGLHTCKRGNEPRVGDTKTFLVEPKVGKSGKEYLKIKSAGPDYGGTPHTIISAEQTDFVDSHGNLSFNLEIEPADGSEAPAAAAGAPPARQNAPARQPQPKSPQDALTGFQDAVRRSLNAQYMVLKATSKMAEQAEVDDVAITPEMLQSLVMNTMIEVSRAGFISSLPTEPVWRPSAGLAPEDF